MAVAQPYILLIDDDPLSHDAVKMILEPKGYRVAGCLTGAAGLAAMRAEKPDLLLLDIMLTAPSEGLFLAYGLRKDETLHDVPIIMLSAIGETMGRFFAKEIGCDQLFVDRFLEKPFDATTLLAVVREVLAQAAVA